MRRDFVVRALKRSFRVARSWLGLGATLAGYFITAWGVAITRETTIAAVIIGGDFVNNLILLCLIFFVVWLVNLVWEFRVVLPRIRVDAQGDPYTNTLSVEIRMDDSEDIDELSVELKSWNMQLRDGSFASAILPKNNVHFEAPKHVGYESHVNVPIAKARNGQLIICLSEEYTNRIYEEFNDTRAIAFELNIEVKGRVEGRPILPIEFSRRIIFNCNLDNSGQVLRWQEKDLPYPPKFYAGSL